MSELEIDYARVSTDAQDLAAQRASLIALGAPAERIYVDHGMTGTTRDRLGSARYPPPAGPDRAIRRGGPQTSGASAVPAPDPAM